MAGRRWGADGGGLVDFFEDRGVMCFATAEEWVDISNLNAGDGDAAR